jgi:hypothetical protein
MAMLAGPGTANPLVGDLRRSGLVTLLVLLIQTELGSS